MYYLQVKNSRIAPLLVSVESDISQTCTFSILNAIKFTNRMDAKSFISENNLSKQYKIIRIEDQ